LVRRDRGPAACDGDDGNRAGRDLLEVSHLCLLRWMTCHATEETARA
jgi:hypothetical protein